MLRRALRVTLAVTLCPALGAALGRRYVAPLMGGVEGSFWGWVAGLAVGAAYAVVLLSLALAAAGTARRMAGDLILISLATLALANIAAQLVRAEEPWIGHATGLVYMAGLMVCARRALSGAREPTDGAA